MIVRDTDARFVIDPVSGEITNNSEKDSITQGSHNSEVFTFEMPRDIGHDMMNCNLVEVHYINIKAKDKTQTSEGIYKVNDLQVCPEDEKKVILSWTIDGSATVHQGTLSFSIHFKCISDDGKCLYRWPTKTFNKMGVTSCVDTTDAVMEENQDIIAEWEARISALEQNGDGVAAPPYYIDVDLYYDLPPTIRPYSWLDLMREIDANRSVVCRVNSVETVYHLPFTNIFRHQSEIHIQFSAVSDGHYHEVTIADDGNVDYISRDATSDLSQPEWGIKQGKIQTKKYSEWDEYNGSFVFYLSQEEYESVVAAYEYSYSDDCYVEYDVSGYPLQTDGFGNTFIYATEDGYVVMETDGETIKPIPAKYLEVETPPIMVVRLYTEGFDETTDTWSASKTPKEVRDALHSGTVVIGIIERSYWGPYCQQVLASTSETEGEVVHFGNECVGSVHEDAWYGVNSGYSLPKETDTE